jgi:hypothetical protein
VALIFSVGKVETPDLGSGEQSMSPQRLKHKTITITELQEQVCYVAPGHSDLSKDTPLGSVAAARQAEERCRRQ